MKSKWVSVIVQPQKVRFELFFEGMGSDGGFDFDRNTVPKFNFSMLQGFFR